MAKIKRNNRMIDKIKKYSKLNLIEILVVAILAFVWFFSNFACQNPRKTPLSSSPGEYPPTPYNLKAKVYDKEVILSWEVSDTSDIYKYNILRKDSSETEVSLIDSSFSRKYVDRGLVNGNRYFYQVSSVNGEGFESKRSKLVSAIPNLYDVIINNNAEYTNSRQVTLTITAPVGTSYMKVSNDSTFGDASWEVFASVKSWTLVAGDGEKFVYVLFRDNADHETSRPAYDSIILDTKAVIEEVYENTNGNAKAPGDSIHFKVITGEPEGEASIDIGNVKTGLKLYDDGSNGDNLANDGVYELEYKIPRGLEVSNALITAHFTDRIGNIADAVTAPGKVTIQQPPTAVELYTPTPVGNSLTALNISWSQNTDTDFASYKIFRAKSPGVTSSSTLVTTITTQSTVTYDDTGLKEDETYYYKVYVFDKAGLSTGSNEVSGKTSKAESPEPVTLFNPTNSTEHSLTLIWTQSRDDDFAAYRVFRSKSPGVDTTAVLDTTIITKSFVSYVDTELDSNTTYYYKVFVYNTYGLSSPSNEVQGKTKANEPPQAVILYTPIPDTTSVSLNWSQNEDTDFASYMIFRSNSPGVDNSSQSIATITSRSQTNFRDTGLKENTTYYYKVYVYDKAGLYAGSNEVDVKTKANAPPLAVTLYTPIPNTDSITLNWSQNIDSDFASYKVFRSSTSGVDSSAQLIAVITDQFQTTYTDSQLEQNTTYYYRVYVYDQRGLSAGSNEVESKTKVNEPPEAVSLYTPIPNITSIALNWSENNDKDFASYKIFRSRNPGVDNSSQLIHTIAERGQTNFTDTGLQQNTTYYYKVYVYDKGGLSAGSNEVNSTTLVDEPPDSVTLFVPINATQSSLYLTWTQSKDEDFSSYRLFRSETPGVSNSSYFVTIIIDKTVTYFTDTGLEDNTTYYYRLYVYDQVGNATPSNEVSGETTANEAPTPVILSVPSVVDSTTLRLSWSRNEDGDFSSYRIYRSESSPVDTLVAPITLINERSTTTYNDVGLEKNKTYYYRVLVFDKGGLSSSSNEVSGTPR
ncbi:hypothetical protein DRQ11_03090 [candidate division KSB1 bacterium]|nr:MAG: hypothetical protein DRQ11_03090 [candidate division KSB1 bacterium]